MSDDLTCAADVATVLMRGGAPTEEILPRALEAAEAEVHWGRLPAISAEDRADLAKVLTDYSSI